MPHDLTPEQREALSGALRWVAIGPFGPNALGIINEGGVTHLSGSERDAAVDELAPVVEQLLADERERIAHEIESRRTRFMPGLVEQGVFAYNDAARIARGQA